MWHVDDTVTWSFDLGKKRCSNPRKAALRRVITWCVTFSNYVLNLSTNTCLMSPWVRTTRWVWFVDSHFHSWALVWQWSSNIDILNFLLSAVFTPHVGRRSVVQSSSDNCGFKSQGKRQESKQKTWMRINKLSELLLLSIRAEAVQWDCHSQ